MGCVLGSFEFVFVGNQIFIYHCKWICIKNVQEHSFESMDEEENEW